MVVGNIFMRQFLTLLLTVSFLVSQAQFTYRADTSVPVNDLQGELLRMPWAGGLNAIQYNSMDLDQDGIEDLVLFDRMANKIIPFLARENRYQHAPEFEVFFPSMISNWMLLRDYNCDGKKDIFTGDILGIRVFTNITSPGENLQWKPFRFYTGFSGQKSDVLLTTGFSGKINLQLQYDDLPSISDADGDGDLDIFNVRFVGDATVEFHKNLSREKNFGCDSLDFERITQSWGNFRECNCGEFAFMGENCTPNHGGRTKHAGGKALLLLDTNEDGQQDLLFSESECPTLFSLPNEGTLNNPVITSSSAFPSPAPAVFSIFPAPSYEDVDFDGKRDLLVSPNIFSKENNLNVNLGHSNWFYRNTGTDDKPRFALERTNFLQHEMIDVGDNAVPAFADYDGDGDYDLFISRNSSPVFASTVFLYENIGNAREPAFQLVNEDYFNFSTARLFNVKLQFTDMNGDNTIDLVFTATSFDNGLTRLYYYPNKSQHVFDFSSQTLQQVDFSLTYNENLYLTDVNSDGKPDILVGRNNGRVEYWKNSGTASTPAFQLEDDEFLGMGASVLRQNVQCFVADLNDDGMTDLLMGDQTGVLRVVNDYKNANDATAAFTIQVFNARVNEYGSRNLGGRLWPVAVNLFSANKPVIVSGSILGGVTLLRPDDSTSLPEHPVVSIFPNPADRNTSVQVQTDRPLLMQVVSLLGHEVSEPVLIQPGPSFSYSHNLAAGLYLMVFRHNERLFSRRFVIR